MIQNKLTSRDVCRSVGERSPSGSSWSPSRCLRCHRHHRHHDGVPDQQDLLLSIHHWRSGLDGATARRCNSFLAQSGTSPLHACNERWQAKQTKYASSREVPWPSTRDQIALPQISTQTGDMEKTLGNKLIDSDVAAAMFPLPRRRSHRTWVHLLVSTKLLTLTVGHVASKRGWQNAQAGLCPISTTQLQDSLKGPATVDIAAWDGQGTAPSLVAVLMPPRTWGAALNISNSYGFCGARVNNISVMLN